MNKAKKIISLLVCTAMMLTEKSSDKNIHKYVCTYKHKYKKGKKVFTKGYYNKKLAMKFMFDKKRPYKEVNGYRPKRLFYV